MLWLSWEYYDFGGKGGILVFAILIAWCVWLSREHYDFGGKGGILVFAILIAWCVMVV